mmetsp:Transcript_322/g.573  ORF Transcript_322/g.573 Transcript_322/m.573 type:complete len:241 (-) Transcript_322:1476-2198(-)
MFLTEVFTVDDAQFLNHISALLEAQLSMGRGPLLYCLFVLLAQRVVAERGQELFDLLLVQRATPIKIAFNKSFLHLHELLLLVPAHDLEELVKVNLTTFVNVDFVHKVLLLLDGAGVATPSQCSTKFDNIYTIGVVGVMGTISLSKFLYLLGSEPFALADQPKHQINIIERQRLLMIYAALMGSLLNKLCCVAGETHFHQQRVCSIDIHIALCGSVIEELLCPRDLGLTVVSHHLQEILE